MIGPGMDLTIGELMQAAARNDERALACSTLWAWGSVAEGARCQQGINLTAVIETPRAEAVLRGHSPQENGRTPG